MSDFSLLLNQLNKELQPNEKDAALNQLVSQLGLLHPIPFFTDASKAEELWQSFLKYENIKENIAYPFKDAVVPNFLEDEEVKKRFPNAEKCIPQVNKAIKESNINYFEIQKIEVLKDVFYCFKPGEVVMLTQYKGAETYLIFPFCQLLASDNNKLQDNSDANTELVGSFLSGIPAGLNNISLNDIESLGQMLSFALPPPWGPVVAAGIMFFQFLFGKPKNTQMATLVKQLLEGVKKVIEEEDDITLINNIEAFSQAFDVKLNVMSEDPTNIDYMLENIIPLLRNALDPSFGGSLYNSFEQILRKQYYVPKNGNDKLGFATYQLIAASTMTFSLIHKIFLQIYSLTASRYAQKDKDKFNEYTSLWLGTFEDWYILLKGGDSPKVTGLLDLLANARSNIIRARNNSISIHIVGPNIQEYYFYTNYSFTDSWTGEKGGFGYCLMGDSNCGKSMNKQIDNFKASRASEFVTALDQLVNIPTIVAKTDLAFKMWMNHIKPIAPTENEITLDFSKSGVPTPEGKWTNGSSVRYAVKFKNTVGDDTSPWTDYFEIKDKAYPTLNNIPIDKHRLTQRRWIVRQFKGEDQEDVGVIGDNTTTVWVDKKKD